MDTRLLRYFLGVAKHGTMARAADEVHLTQPALSKNIQRLERELGLKLFDRTPAGVTLTAYGRALVEHATNVQSEMTMLREQMRELREGRAGHVTVGCGRGGILEALAAEATIQLSRRLPGIRVSAVAGLVDELIPALRSGDIDLVLGSGAEATLPPGVQATQLFRDDVGVVARAGHPLRRRRGLALADLLQHGWVLPSAAHGFSKTLARCFTTAGLPLPTPTVVGSSISFIARVVAATDYLTFLPLSLVTKDGKGGIAALNVPGSTCSRSVQLLRRARVSPSPAVHAMEEEIRALVGARRGRLVKAPFDLPQPGLL